MVGEGRGGVAGEVLGGLLVISLRRIGVAERDGLILVNLVPQNQDQCLWKDRLRYDTNYGDFGPVDGQGKGTDWRVGTHRVIEILKVVHDDDVPRGKHLGTHEAGRGSVLALHRRGTGHGREGDKD